MTKDALARISELTAKSRTKEGLTLAEKEQREVLRAQYIAEMRQSIKSQIENTDVIDADGKVTPLSKIAKSPK